MFFGRVGISEAVGGVCAHAVRLDDLVIKKGHKISADDAARLERAGIRELVIARMAEGDVAEDEAALRLAAAVSGGGLRADKPFTGRCNLFATQAGVLVIDKAAVDRLNAIDETVTFATLPAYKSVEPGEMVATVKIIPFAVDKAVMDQALAEIGDRALIEVKPYQPLGVGAISTLLPGLKPTVVKKTIEALAERLRPAGASIVADERVAHEKTALAEQLVQLVRAETALVVVFGASAITDRRDVIPAAIEEAGGTVEHFGMPVDPGNLLLLGRIGKTIVLGAPGCARSPKENGFDWVLQRILAGIEVTRADIMAMGVGGLLMEIVTRPQPRAGDGPT